MPCRSRMLRRTLECLRLDVSTPMSQICGVRDSELRSCGVPCVGVAESRSCGVS